MPVFNTAANQIPVEPVTNYYKGKALRADIRAREAGADIAEQEAGNYERIQERADAEVDIDQRKVALQEERLGQAVKEWEQSVGKERMVEQANTLIALGEEARASEDPVAYANSKIGPIIESLPDGDTKQYLMDRAADGLSAEELVGIETLSRGAVKQYSQNNEFTAEEKLINRLDISDSEKQRLLKQIAEKKGTVVGRTESDVAAFGGGAGDKPSDRQAREVVTSAYQLTDTVDRISKQIEDVGQSSLGAPGSTAKAVSNAVNAVQGFKELFVGGTAIDSQTGAEITDSELLNPEYYRSYFEDLGGAAAESSALQSNSIGLAYSLARAANPDGRISDADLTNQLKRFNLGASSKRQIQSALFEIKHEILRNAATHLQVNEYTKTEAGQAFHEDILSKLHDMEMTNAGNKGDPVRLNPDNPEESFSKLSSGDLFYDPDGELRRKP